MSLYRYVPSKDDLLESMFDTAVRGAAGLTEADKLLFLLLLLTVYVR